MKLTESDIEDMTKDALREALKDRFVKIAANELTMGPEEGEAQIRRMFDNLRTVYDQVIRIAPEFFSS